MKTRQINKLAAFIALVSVCKQAQSTWTGLKAFKDKFQKFSAKVETLSQFKLQQEAGTTGIAAQKQQCREEACAAAAIVAAGVRAWAEDQGDLVTLGKVDYSYSDLLGGRDTASKDRCQTVQDVAEEHVESLGDHGVDADVLEDLQDKIDAYAACISKPREAVATGKTLTAQIEKEFEAADRLLTKGLDELSQKFKKSAPAFHQDYWNARKVVDTAATRDAEEGGASGPQAKAA
jgi:hypothetical protein